MPLYRFQIETQLTTQTVLERVRALFREPPGFLQWLREVCGWRPDSTAPFIGRIKGNKFKCYRDIQEQNPFLPCITGRVNWCPTGTKVGVTMYLHPFVALLWLILLGSVGLGTAAVLRGGAGGAAFLIAMSILVFGVVLTTGAFCAFYPEAIKARRLLERCIEHPGA